MRKFAGRHVIPDLAGLDARGKQVADEAVQLPLRPGDALTVVQERGEPGALMLVLNERVGPQDGFELLAGAARPVPDPTPIAGREPDLEADRRAALG